MHIGILYLGSPTWTAGHVYSTNLVNALERLPEAERPAFTLLMGPMRNYAWARRLQESYPVATYGYSNGRNLLARVAAAGVSMVKRGSPLSLDRTARDRGIDVLFPVTRILPERVVTPWMAWVADYQCMHMPEHWAASDTSYRDTITSVTREAPFLVVSSENAQRDAKRFFNRTKNVATLPFSLVATPEWFAHDPTDVARRYDLPERFLVFPSQFWKHKDHETLIRATGIVRSRGHDDMTLVLPGAMIDTRDETHAQKLLDLIARLGLTTNVRVLGLIPRPDVIALMRRAVGIVQPSRFEGWSALVEEARTLGKPLIVSDLSVHREQAPPRARFFPVGDSDALAEQMLALWREASSGPDLAAEAAARADAAMRTTAFARRLVAVAKEAIGAFQR
jgi:glycosyltransferase involved in cell wall biosynthesis